MPEYTVKYLPQAEKDLARLPREADERIRKRIRLLQEDARPPGCKALHGEWKGLTRIRVGDYRVVYQIQDALVLVVIVKIAPRSDVYR